MTSFLRKIAMGCPVLALGSSGCFAQADPVDPVSGTGSARGTETQSPDAGSMTTIVSESGPDSTTSTPTSTSASTSLDTTGCLAQTMEVPGVLAPHDVYIVLDTTGSMTAQFLGVQNGLEALAGTPFPPGVHFVLVASAQSKMNSVCMPAPVGLGAGDCDGANPPAFGRTLVNTTVSADSPLDWLEAGVAAPVPGRVLREDATKTIVLISDSEVPVSMEDADAILEAQGPAFADARVFTITGSQDSECIPQAMGNPDFAALAEHFSGETYTLCPFSLVDWTTVARPRPSCRFGVPDSVTEDKTLTVSLWTGMQLDALEIVAGPNMCTKGSQAHFNPGGTQITLCRQTCIDYQNASRSDPGAVVFDLPCGA